LRKIWLGSCSCMHASRRRVTRAASLGRHRSVGKSSHITTVSQPATHSAMEPNCLPDVAAMLSLRGPIEVEHDAGHLDAGCDAGCVSWRRRAPVRAQHDCSLIPATQAGPLPVVDRRATTSSPRPGRSGMREVTIPGWCLSSDPNVGPQDPARVKGESSGSLVNDLDGFPLVRRFFLPLGPNYLHTTNHLLVASCLPHIRISLVTPGLLCCAVLCACLGFGAATYQITCLALLCLHSLLTPEGVPAASQPAPYCIYPNRAQFFPRRLHGGRQ
jgi:hypothetical protein